LGGGHGMLDGVFNEARCKGGKILCVGVCKRLDRGQEGLIAHLNRIQNMDVLAGMLLRDLDDRPQLECAARIPLPDLESMAEPWTFRSRHILATEF
jgi:hypothetical protein